MSINNRQNGRRRGRNNQRPQGNGGQRGNGDQGNRIDSRARGNAAQLLEKYRNMARDAQMSGDRVMTEYYLQFADHYFRVLSDAKSRQDEQRARFEDRDGERDGERGNTAADSTDEAEDLDETLDAIDQIGRAPRNREGREGRETRENNGRDRDGNRDGNRDGRPRERDARRDRPERNDRDDRPERNERPERPERGDRPERSERDGEMTAQRSASPRDAVSRGDREDRPRRQRRERPEREDEAPIGIDIAVLPPAIGIEPPREATATDTVGEEAAPAPKRRGRPRKADVASEGEAAAT